MRLYNSLTRQLEDFKPLDEKKPVGVYTCGPTVYSYVTIGNWRTYTLGDLVVRSLKYLGYEVEYVMNITDVGHLTGDNLGDADTGEDRLEKAAKKEGKTAWDVAEFYIEDFMWGYEQLGLTKPIIFCKATDHIKEQIDLVLLIEEKGFAYRISDGIYFDTQAYEKVGNTYGELSTLDQIREGARVEPNEEKRDKRDFALWKFSPEGVNRDMEWESPWGVGFPGWHIECSAMGMKYLGAQFDIHLGGEDLRSTHHPNEIAQSEAATGKRPFVRYWMHGAFLLVDGGRMGKSLGNAFTMKDVVDRGFSPLALRYFYLTGHYRKQLNFTWEGLEAAAKTLENLRSAYGRIRRLVFSSDKDVDTYMKFLKGVLPFSGAGDYFKQFEDHLRDDLNLPEVLATVWKMLRDPSIGENPTAAVQVLAMLDRWDEVLGFALKRTFEHSMQIPEDIVALAKKRDAVRLEKDWTESDRLRKEIEDKGYEVEDTKDGAVVRRR